MNCPYCIEIQCEKRRNREIQSKKECKRAQGDLEARKFSCHTEREMNVLKGLGENKRKEWREKVGEKER